MAAKDTFHDAVKSALEKDGWHITQDPLYINFAEIEIYIDLGAERLLYLAIPLEAYETFFARRFVQFIVQEYQLKLIVFNPAIQEIIQWKK